MYGPDGSLTKILVDKFGAEKVRTKLFAEMQHGWVPRGDIKNESVKRDVKIAIDEAVEYFKDMDLLSK